MRRIFKNSRFCLLFVLLFATGCNVFDTDERLSTPSNLTVIGDTIIWNTVANSKEYEIYKDDVLVGKTQYTYYVAGDIAEDEHYSVKAIANEGYLDSLTSNRVIVQKNCSFEESEISEILLESDEVFEISQSIFKVVFRMADSVTVAQRTYISILPRTKDLIIELNDVSLIAPDYKPAIALTNEKYGISEAPFTLTIISNGINKIVGGKSSIVPAQPAVNTQRNGLTGDSGKSAIIMNHVLFKGSGNLEIIGGNGAPGGKGSDSSGFSSAVYGNGGKGGDGANGLTSNKYVVNLIEQGSITAKGGIGGKGGSPGANGSIITGPLNTARWKDSFGIDGYKGLGLSGVRYQIQGLIILD
ncbi:MAG: hypothetical protein EOM77_00435 [Bacteroidia bacterium]|nr:hypothetical protein [Bacteroidia bacterium]